MQVTFALISSLQHRYLGAKHSKGLRWPGTCWGEDVVMQVMWFSTIVHTLM